MTESDHVAETTPAELGLEAGKNAFDPLGEFSNTFGDAFDQASKKQFLDSYLVGIKQFFQERGLVVPILSHLEDISQSWGLSGFIQGLNRQRPNPKEGLEPPSGEYNDPKTWEYTLNLVVQITYEEGYFLGFMAGIARDYDLSFSHWEVPSNLGQFKVFCQGQNGEPRVYSPETIGANWATETDRKIALQFENQVYEGGLKLWLHERNLDMDLVSEISHPEALAAFKLALEGRALEADTIPGSPQHTGYLLGQAARRL